MLEELSGGGVVSESTRRRLARVPPSPTLPPTTPRSFAGWTRPDPDAHDSADPLPETLHVVLERAKQLRYGENPHQNAAFYRARGDPADWWEGAVQHGGRELSYLNLLDAEAAWQLVHELVGPMASASGAALPQR